MGLFSGILGAVGSVFGPIGSAVGGAIGGAIDGSEARSDAHKDQDAANAFNAQQALLQRNWSSREAVKTRAFNAEQADISRDFNSVEAEASRAWQEARMREAMSYDTAMSNSAWQRGVADMKAAGLNPMLAYAKGGASAPTISVPSGASASGSSASGGNPSGASASGFEKASAVASALRAAELAQNVQESNARIRNIDADTVLKSAQTNRETSSAANLDMSTREIEQRTKNLHEELYLIRAKQGTELWHQTVMDAQAEVLKLEKGLRYEQIGLVEAQTRYERIKTLLSSLAEPQARNAANAQDSWWMRHVSPYLPDFAKSTGAAGAIGRIIP